MSKIYNDLDTGKKCELIEIPHEDEQCKKSVLLRMVYEDGSSIDAKPDDVGNRFLPEQQNPN